jgi:hypothetical protein
VRAKSASNLAKQVRMRWRRAVATAWTTSSIERAVNAPAGSTGAASWKEAPACA